MRVLSVVLLLVLAQPAVAAPGAPDETVRFHRVFVPESRTREWPTDGAKYLPMDAADFERLVQAAQPRTTRAPVPPPAAIIAASYRARLTGERLVGHATLDVVLAGAKSALLPIGPCNFSIAAATWQSSSNESQHRRLAANALLGLDSENRLALCVDRSAQLKLDWSLLAHRNPDEALCFRMELPPSPANQLILDLPRGVSPDIDCGMVLGSEPVGSAARRWRIELGANRACRLRINSQDASPPRRLLALAEESRTYECSVRGLELSSQWRLHAHNQPLKQITLLVDLGLQLVSARVGETDVPWTILPAESEGFRRVVLNLPEPIRESGRAIRLGAIGPTTIDRSWRLPRIRAEGLFWQQGTITLLVPEPLLIDRLVPMGCTQTDAGPLAVPRKGQSARFQCFDQDATIELSLGQMPAKQLSSDFSSARDAVETSEQPPRSQSSDATATPATALPKTQNGFSCVTAIRTESWCQSTGEIRHVATYELSPSDRCQFELVAMPRLARADVRSIQIDGKLATWQWLAGRDGAHISVLAPAGGKRLCVVEWTSKGPRLGFIGSIQASPPQPKLPVRDRCWTVHLPHGYEAGGEARVSSSTRPTTWSQRLFGPLGRSDGGRCFNPFSIDQWLSFLGRPTPALPQETAIKLQPSALPMRLVCVHYPTIQLLGSAVMLMTAALGCWKGRRHPVTVTASLAAFSAAALMLPAVFSPLASGGVLGLLFCVAWQSIRPSTAKTGECPPQPVRGNSDSTISMAWPLGVVLLSVAATLFLQKAIQAATPVAATGDATESRSDANQRASLSPERTTVGHRPDFAVLIPCDAKRKPVGGKIYAPELLYQKLQRVAATVARPPAWMIVGATYRADLTRDAATASPRIEAVRAEYDLHCFRQDTRVRIPFDVPVTNLLLDGQPVDPEQDVIVGPSLVTTSGVAPLSFVVGEPGRHRLQVAMRPPLSGGTTKGGFDLPIPRVPTARLEISLPNDDPHIEVPSAYGAVGIANDRLTADLGPTDRLTVDWQKTAMSRRRPAVTDAQQLFWVKVQPGCVIITTKINLDVGNGQLNELHLAVDPRLRLLPLTGDNSPVVNVAAETSQGRPVTFRWPKPISGNVALEAAFLVTGASGMGNFCLPQIELLDAAIAPRWLAVTVDPSLDCDEQPPKSLIPVSVSDFLKVWRRNEGKAKAEGVRSRANGSGNAGRPISRDMVPQAAYCLPAGPIAWTLGTRPHQPRCAADQVLSLSFDADHVDFVFDGQVSIAEGCVFQHRIVGPRGLKIDSVSVFEGDAERALRWAQDKDGVVTVFLNGPGSGREHISVLGRLPIPHFDAATQATLPLMRLEKCRLGSASIRVFHRPGVLLTIHDAPTGARTSPLSVAAARDLGIPVVTIPWDGHSPSTLTATLELDRSVRSHVALPSLSRTNDERVAAKSPLTALPAAKVLPDRDPLFPRLVAAIAMVLLGMLAIVATQRGWLAPLARRPCATGVLLGLAWWLWLSPSVLGLVIALACLGVAAQRRAM